MQTQSPENLIWRIDELENRLAEAEQLIEAIKSGEVDAFALKKNDQPEVFTLHSGDYAYRVLVENFSEGALNLSEEGLIVYTNTSFYEILQLTYEKVIGKNIFEFIHPESEEIFRELFRKGLAGQSKGEINLVTGNSIIPVYVSFTSLYPTLPTVGVVVSDLRESKAHEQTLLQNKELEIAKKTTEDSEKRYNMMLMQSPFAFAVFSGKQLIITLANDRMKEVLGKGSNIENQPLLKVLPELINQPFAGYMHQVLETGKAFYANEALAKLNRNGKLEDAYFNFVYQPYREVDGSISGITCIAYEVTNEVIAKQKIEESEKRFRTLAQTLPQLVWVTDAEGKAEFASFRWKEYTGIEPGGEKEWRAIVHPDDYNNINAVWMHSLSTGNTYMADVRLKNKEGEYRWHSVLGKPVLEQGRIIKWAGAFIDVHDQKIKDDKKDEFISIASHELKTPLTTAKAYLQMLEFSIEEKNEDATLYAKKASQSVDRINELIGELLDVSKIRLGKLNYTITTFNFNEMIENTVESMQLTSLTHTIVKAGKVQDEVTGDEDRLQQVVINLLNNAIKYSPNSNKVFINVEQDNDIIKVTIKDTGIGISRQNLSKIFDKYHRIEEHSMHFQGLGIGLFISYEIIQRHNGKLSVESEPGKGSTFYFTIPVK